MPTSKSTLVNIPNGPPLIRFPLGPEGISVDRKSALPLLSIPNTFKELMQSFGDERPKFHLVTPS